MTAEIVVAESSEDRTPNPFSEIVLTPEEKLDQRERDIYPEGVVRRTDYGKFVPETFRRALVAVDLEYRRRGRIPTIAEVHDSWPQIEKQTYSELYGFRGFRDALQEIGISITAGEGLSQDQISALLVICDPTDRRTISAKMKSLGHTYSVYQAWMRDPVFKAERSRRAKENLDDVVPLAMDKLVGNVDSGDQRAIEFALEMKGVYSKDQKGREDAMKVVYLVLEAVQRNVKDRDVLNAILNDVRVAGLSYDIANPF